MFSFKENNRTACAISKNKELSATEHQEKDETTLTKVKSFRKFSNNKNRNNNRKRNNNNNRNKKNYRK